MDECGLNQNIKIPASVCFLIFSSIQQEKFGTFTETWIKYLQLNLKHCIFYWFSDRQQHDDEASFCKYLWNKCFESLDLVVIMFIHSCEKSDVLRCNNDNVQINSLKALALMSPLKLQYCIKAYISNDPIYLRFWGAK